MAEECVLCNKPIQKGKGKFFGNGYYAHENCADSYDHENHFVEDGSYPL